LVRPSTASSCLQPRNSFAYAYDVYNALRSKVTSLQWSARKTRKMRWTLLPIVTNHLHVHILHDPLKKQFDAVRKFKKRKNLLYTGVALDVTFWFIYWSISWTDSVAFTCQTYLSGCLLFVDIFPNTLDRITNTRRPRAFGTFPQSIRYKIITK